MSEGWWRDYFGADFFHLHVDLFPEALTRREVAGMLELLRLPVGARILDVPCGWGRHAVLLADHGYQVTGADLSYDLLRRAAPGPLYLAADVRAQPLRAAAFDAVINVFTSLGLFLDDQEDLNALREAHRLLQPGGRFLLESMHRDDVIGDFAERDRWRLPDGTEVRVRRRFDPIRGISHERLQWRNREQRGRKQHALRLRTATEIAALLGAAGFDDVEYFGDWDGRPFTYRDSSLIAVATKR
ncbi:MAG TPA: methyltransferase domain-containing protein [Longimicrobiales bacterium]|nr:methyltransferase domain-containing protein [Longimicrobiales bacterium]